MHPPTHTPLPPQTRPSTTALTAGSFSVGDHSGAVTQLRHSRSSMSNSRPGSASHDPRHPQHPGHSRAAQLQQQDEEQAAAGGGGGGRSRQRAYSALEASSASRGGGGGGGPPVAGSRAMVIGLIAEATVHNMNIMASNASGVTQDDEAMFPSLLTPRHNALSKGNDRNCGGGGGGGGGPSSQQSGEAVVQAHAFPRLYIFFAVWCVPRVFMFSRFPRHKKKFLVFYVRYFVFHISPYFFPHEPPDPGHLALNPEP